MLQEQYEKHNLEMQPYRHYLAEYQNMDPRDISRHLEIPFNENTGLFRVNFMERSYTVSHPDLEIHCLDYAAEDAAHPGHEPEIIYILYAFVIPGTGLYIFKSLFRVFGCGSSSP